MRSAARLLLLIAALSASACSEDIPASPSTFVPSPLQEIFSATLAPGESTFYAFTTVADGAVRLTLTGALDAAGNTLSPSLKLGLGVPKDDGCAVTSTVSASPSLAAQVISPAVAGNYCVSVADAGSLSGAVTFYVRMSYPIGSVPAGTPGSETWASTLPLGGTATRTFVATAPGISTVKLDTLTNSSASLLLAIGLPDTDGRGCYYTRAITTKAGSGQTIEVNTDPGLYCVRLVDSGQLTANTTFSVILTHP